MMHSWDDVAIVVGFRELKNNITWQKHNEPFSMCLKMCHCKNCYFKWITLNSSLSLSFAGFLDNLGPYHFFIHCCLFSCCGLYFPVQPPLRTIQFWSHKHLIQSMSTGRSIVCYEPVTESLYEWGENDHILGLPSSPASISENKFVLIDQWTTWYYPLPSCDRPIIFSQMVTTFIRTLSTTDIINFSRKHGYSCIILTGILQQKWPVRSGVRDPLQSSWASMWPRTLESVYPMRAGGSVWRMSSRRRGSLSKPKTSPCPTFWSTSALDFGKSRCSCTLHWTACGALAYQEGTSQQLAHRFAWLTLMRCMWF